MFTGIVEALGTLVDVQPSASGHRAAIRTALAGSLALGDSLAVNGVCLTVTHIDGDEVRFDIGPETARVTTLGALKAGQSVNLERPMQLDGRLGGHLVLGHVDGVGAVKAVRRDGECQWFTIAFPGTLAPLFIRKGSVAVDGVSLTVADLREGEFEVQIVPFTLGATTFGRLQAGDRVNLECDMIGKYVARAVEVIRATNEERRTKN